MISRAVIALAVVWLGWSPVASFALEIRGLEQPRKAWSATLVDDVICQPAVDAERMYIGTSSGQVLALDRASHRVVWQQPVGLDHMLRLARVADRVLVSCNGKLIALDASTGVEVWRRESHGTGLEELEVLEDAALNVGRDGNLEALEPLDGRLRWRSTAALQSICRGCLATAGGRVFVPCEARVVCALDAKDGRVLWRKPLEALAGRPGADFLRAGRDRLVFSFEGAVHALAAEDGRPLWQRAVRTPTGLQLAGDRVLVASFTDLSLLDAATGEVRAKSPPAEQGRSGFEQPAMCGDFVVKIEYPDRRGEDARLRGLRRADLAQAWEIPLRKGGQQVLPVSCVGGRILGGWLGGLWSIDPASGQAEKVFSSGGRMTAPAVGCGEAVLAGREDGTVMALNAATGAPLWTRKVAEGPVRRLLPAAGAVVASGEGWSVGLGCVEGKTLWSRRTPDQEAKLVTPAGVVLAGPGGSLELVDPATGRSRWKADAGARVDIVRAEGARVVVSTREGGVVALVLKSGKRAGTFDAGGSVRGLAVAQDAWIVRSPAERLRAIDPRTGKVRWEKAALPGPGSAMAAGDGFVWLGQGEGILALDLATGAERWRFGGLQDRSPDGEPRPWMAPPLLLRDRLLVADTRGVLHVLERDTGRELWKYEIGEMINGAPHIAGERMLLSTLHGRVHAVEMAERPWPAVLTAQVGEEPAFWPVWADGHIVLGDSQGVIRAYDGATGKPSWEWSNPGLVPDKPVELGKRLIFGTRGGSWIALEARTGREVWRAVSGQRSAESPRSVGDHLLAISANDGDRHQWKTAGYFYLHSLDPASGKERWRVGPLSSRQRRLSLYGDLVVFPLAAGELLALEASTGQERWRVASVFGSDQMGSAGTPLLGKDLIVAFRQPEGAIALERIDPATGRALWSVPERLGSFVRLEQGTLSLQEAGGRGGPSPVHCRAVEDGAPRECPVRPKACPEGERFFRGVRLGGKLVGACERQAMCLWEEATCKELGRVELPEEFWDFGSLENGWLHVRTRTGLAVILDPKRLFPAF